MVFLLQKKAIRMRSKVTRLMLPNLSRAINTKTVVNLNISQIISAGEATN